MAYTLETATWRDFPALRHIEAVCFERDAWPMLDLFAALTVPGVIRIKAVVDDRMVAFAGGDPRPREGVGWVTTIAVLPEFRRQGIANALLDEVEPAMHMPRVRLCVKTGNDNAIRLYLRRGYHQINTWRRYYSGGEDALVMEKVLSNS